MPAWSVTCEVPLPESEERAAALWEAGASGVEVREEGVAPMPGQRAAAPGHALLVAWFASREAAEQALDGAGAPGELAEIPDQDWGESWKRDLRPFQVGRVFVRPSWIDEPPPPGCAEVVLDPGMAFGTGSHPTTALCLRALSRLLADRPGQRLLDVGTGSGLLAIAAARLGAAAPVVATDNDPVAIDVARENAERNGVSLSLHLVPDPPRGGPFDVVVANILANTLSELAPELAAALAPGGCLLLSGLLAGQEDAVREAFLREGLLADPEGDASEGEWRLVSLRRQA